MIDDALLKRWQKIPVSVAVDYLPDHCQIDPAIRPLLPPGQQPLLFGQAVTALCAPPDFGSVLQALSHLKAGSVLVIDAQANPDYAMIGDVLCSYLVKIGAAGVICDGPVRDTRTLAQFNTLPVYSRSITPRGPKGGTSNQVNKEVLIGGCKINEGDLIIGDDDGLIAIPPAYLGDYIERCEEKLKLEELWINRLKAGDAIHEIFNLK